MNEATDLIASEREADTAMSQRALVEAARLAEPKGVGEGQRAHDLRLFWRVHEETLV
jgi:hypothetical protein